MVENGAEGARSKIERWGAPSLVMVGVTNLQIVHRTLCETGADSRAAAVPPPPPRITSFAEGIDRLQIEIHVKCVCVPNREF